MGITLQPESLYKKQKFRPTLTPCLPAADLSGWLSIGPNNRSPILLTGNHVSYDTRKPDDGDVA
jgi:hypothetical protein